MEKALLVYCNTRYSSGRRAGSGNRLDSCDTYDLGDVIMVGSCQHPCSPLGGRLDGFKGERISAIWSPSSVEDLLFVFCNAVNLLWCPGNKDLKAACGNITW